MKKREKRQKKEFYFGAARPWLRHEYGEKEEQTEKREDQQTGIKNKTHKCPRS